MSCASRLRSSVVLILAALFLVCAAALGVATVAARQAGGGAGAGQGAGPGGAGTQRAPAPPATEWRIDPMRGPVDLGLTDPSLVGAIDVHQHIDPDAPGSGGQVRAIDAFEATVIAKQRGMRGIVFKTHQDPASAAVSYLVRTHAVPGFDMFGRMALNFSTGGINVAAVEHFTQIKGGWGRIVEMPTRDSCGSGTPNMSPEFLQSNRPWMLLMPAGSPQCIPTVRNGALLPEMVHLIAAMAKMRTVDSNGPLVLATGHATGEEHLLITREGRKQGLQVLLTHPRFDVPEVAEAAKLGAFVEMNASGIYKTEAGQKNAADFVRKIGAEHIIVGTDCGQTTNLYPTDCLVLTARGLRAQGVTQGDIDLMYKVNAAKLLGLAPFEDTVPSAMPTRTTRTR